MTHVYVCSRNDLHEKHVELAAAAGKHVLCEKPLAETSDAALRMVEMCARHGVAFGTGFHLRHNPAHREAKRLLASGVIGGLIWVDVTYIHELSHGDSAGRLASSRAVDTPSHGAMAGTGTHAADLVQWFAGDRVDGVRATICEFDPTASGPQRVVQVSGKTRGGVLVTLAAGRALYPANGVSMIGETGRITVSGSLGKLGDGRVVMRSTGSEADVSFPPSDVYANQFEGFAEASAAHISPNASGCDGFFALQFVDAIERALTIPSEVRVSVRAGHQYGGAL